MKCIECGRKIGILDEECPYCGAKQYDDTTPPRSSAPIWKRSKEPVYTEEECLIYGIHPDDELYRKTLELNVLGKNYK